MGSVYLAQQIEPVKRQVALKLIKTGMDSTRVLARFEAERRALALMDHPNIARVFDGGTTLAGQPFFVMELVAGVPITRYCDEHRLGPAARLALFVPICNAVQHAHQKGIIHRDLKPGNVLVTEVDGRPMPKVIDFGVAKATEQRLTDQSFGDTGAIVGTPTYMSPEQADPSSMDIDTRTDIYALGVMLYELLVGSPPIEAKQFRRGAFLEMMRMIREVEPPRPSTKLSATGEIPRIAASRDIEPAQLLKWLRGDVDWIVMKALEKDRERRHATANGFAADILRFLADEPIVARPPSGVYRLRKFIKRNKGRVVAASLLLLAMVAGMFGTTIGMVEARTQRDIAEKARIAASDERARAVAERDLKEKARAAEAEQRQRAEQANQQAFEALKSFTDDLMSKVLGSKDRLTETEKAILRNAQRQWEVFARSRGESADARVIQSEGAAELAIVQYKLGMNVEAEENDRVALNLRTNLATKFPDVPLYRLRQGVSYQNLGASLRQNGNRVEAESNFQKAVDVFRRLAAEFHDVPNYRRRLAESLISLGNTKRARQDWSGAEGHYRDALVIQEKLAAESSQTPLYREALARSHWGLAFTLKQTDRKAECEAEYRKSLDLKEKLVAELASDATHRTDVANLSRELGNFLSDNGKGEAGALLFPRAIENLGQLAAEFPSMPVYRQDLERCRRDFGKILGELKRPAEASEQFQKAVALGEKLVVDNPTVLGYQADLGLTYYYFATALRDTGSAAESLPWYGKAIQTLSSAYDRDRQMILTKNALYKCHADRARALDHLEQHADAIREWDQAIDLAPSDRWPVFRGLRAMTRARAGQLSRALAELVELTRSDPADPYHWYNLACVHAMSSTTDAARRDEYARRAVEQLQEAVKVGYKDASHMAKDVALVPLHNRDDFKKLVADLATTFPAKLGPALDPGVKK